MLKNYLNTVLRSMLRHRFFSFINIFGLAVAMALSMCIIMLVADQMMYDRYNTKRDRIYRINSIVIGRNDENFNETSTTALPLKQDLLENSLTRAREIGVRKVTGAMRWQIFLQFLSESVVVSLFALGLAIVLLIVLKPLMLQLSFARILWWDLEADYLIFAIFFAFALVVGILAGFFPAVVLSRFQPIKVLKSLNNVRLFSNMRMRKTLLVAQFTFSLIFILSVIVVFNQLQLFMRADHGFNMKEKMIVSLNNTNHQTLKTELLKYNNIESVTAVSHIPAAGFTFGDGFKKSLDEKEWASLSYFAVDEDYLKNIEVGLKAGKYFSSENGASNKNFIVLNESALEVFRFKSSEEAIGQEIIQQKDSSRKMIIGVVRNYNHQMLMEKLEPMALVYNPTEFRILQVKYNGTYEEAGKTIESVWSTINPSLKVNFPCQ